MAHGEGGYSKFTMLMMVWSLFVGALFGMMLAADGVNPIAPLLAQPAPHAPITTVPLANSNLSMVFNGSFGDHLPSGVNWSISISCEFIPGANGACVPLHLNVTGTIAEFVLGSNAYYRWTVVAPSNFSASPHSGTVSGSEFVNVNVTFTNLTTERAITAEQDKLQSEGLDGAILLIGSIVGGALIGRTLRIRNIAGPYVVAGEPVEASGDPENPEWFGIFDGAVPRTTLVDVINAGVGGERYESDAKFPDAPDTVSIDVILPWRRGLFDRRGK